MFIDLYTYIIFECIHYYISKDVLPNIINKLLLNKFKTKFMVIGKKCANLSCKLYINEFVIERVFINKTWRVIMDANHMESTDYACMLKKLFRSLTDL